VQSSKINLSNGRCLGYAEYGNTRGQPLFFFHGQPRNRLFWHTDETLTASLNVRLIVVDSPGYRLSDFQPWRKLLDWPRDVSKFADALGIGQFAVLGFSAGGPYALACVHQIPEQLTLVGIADSAPPMYLPEINCSAHGSLRTNYLLAWDAPGVLRILFKVFWAYSRRNPDAFLKMAQVQSPRTDKDIMSLPGFHSMLSEGWKENLREDSGGYVQDIEILMKDLGFQLSGIQKEIYLWQGAGDVSTPAARARFMAGELLHCKTARSTRCK
jgi:pimeloyl-ACP methyl ester carboxylesterase